LLRIEKNVNLIAFNTLSFHSIAANFLSITSEEQLAPALDYCAQQQIGYQVLSGGSNLLMAEEIPGLTLHIQIKGISKLKESDSKLTLRVSAGENWHQLVEYSVNNNWQGIENLALIPGLVGASPVQNIGAYGTELKDVLLKVYAYDTQMKRFREFDNKQCEFAYRDSVFKRAKGRYIITYIDIELSKKTNIEAKYQVLKDYFAAKSIKKISLKDVFEGICLIRSSKLPDPKVTPNAGSFFKNPIITTKHFQELKTKYPNIVGYKVSDRSTKVAAGWLIEHCGWKGYRSKAVGVYPKQALVLINTGGATIDQILNLAKKISHSIDSEFNISLEIEPQLFPNIS